MEYLNFMFSGFWVFVGHWILIALVANFVLNMFRAVMRVPITKITNNYSGNKP